NRDEAGGAAAALGRDDHPAADDRILAQLGHEAPRGSSERAPAPRGRPRARAKALKIRDAAALESRRSRQPRNPGALLDIHRLDRAAQLAGLNEQPFVAVHLDL